MAIRSIVASLVISLLLDYTPPQYYARAQQPFLSDSPSLTPHKAKQVLEHRPNAELSQCNLTGPIETTQCDYETLESVNEELHDNLHALVQTPFFRYLKIDLSRECPYWEANGACFLRNCAVTTIDETDIPQAWRTECLSQLNRSSADELRQKLPGCYYRDSDFCVLDDEESGDGEYVDLIGNPERFTGYSGPAAHKIWQAIYDENCFGISEPDFHQTIGIELGEHSLLTTSPFGMTPAHMSPLLNQAHEVEKETCLEKRVFYRIVSGLHASISTHLCQKNFDQKTGEWGPSLQCFIDRVASHPERLQHIYLNALLLLRAMARAGPYLSAYDIHTGISGAGEGDYSAASLVGNVLDIAKNVGQFDEKSLFRGEDAKVLREEFKVHFRNITRIMDCVGCDKCRLWGKVQTSGLGTALKILFELDETALDPRINPHLLQRSEVVTLVNTLHQLSESLRSVNEFRRMWAARESLAASATEDASAPLSSSDEPLTSIASQASPTGWSDAAPMTNTSSRLLSDVLEACRRQTAACADLGVRATYKLVGSFASILYGSDEPEDHPRDEL